MAGTVCGPQFSGKNCDCYLQVTAGKTPATGQASNPLRICSFVSSDGTLLACDPGCCKTDCSLAPDETSSSSSPTSVASSPTSVWWIIVLAVLFGVLIGTSYVYRVVSRNSGSRRVYIAFAALVIIAMIIVAAVGATQKKKGTSTTETATSGNTKLTASELETWDTKTCKGHSMFNGSQTYTPSTFKSEVDIGKTVGFSVYSYNEYCRYGQTQLVDGHDSGWAKLDPCCSV